jgi:hypothetical protein
MPTGANIRLLDRMGRDPLQLAESKLKILQKKNKGDNFIQIHSEVLQVRYARVLKITFLINVSLFFF